MSGEEPARLIWCRVARKRRRIGIGLMSGTSADGIDAALVELEDDDPVRFRLLRFHTWPLEPRTRRAILRLAQSRRTSVERLARLNVRMGELFAEAALGIAAEAGMPPAAIDFIGSHGQTVGHFPESKHVLGSRVRSTLQIGDPAVIAKRTGILTVGDFRVSDIALGGTGAPLVPLFDWLVFRTEARSVAALNIGGISNVTLIPPRAGLAEVIAFDTGPGNALLDSLAEAYFGEAMDRDGQHARRGRVDETWLEELLQHPYFSLPPPKSTGREVFGKRYALQMVAEGGRRNLTPEDVLATATALVARSIADGIRQGSAESPPLEVLYVSGGGARNPVLLEQLRRELEGVEVCSTAEAGIDPDAKEAVAFALLADRTLRGLAGNCPGATGASRPGVLGKICPP